MFLPLVLGYNDKQINSLKDSLDSAVKTYPSVKLKQPCSMKSPVWIVKDLPWPTKINYAIFGNDKYWVDDIISLSNRHWRISAHLDVLATYKAAILENTALVAYGDIDHWSKYMDDTRFSPDFEQIKDQKDDYARVFRTNFGIKFGKTFNEGAVVIQVMDTVGGGMCFYAMTLNNFMRVVSALDVNGMNTAVSLFSGNWSNLGTAVGQDIASLLGGLGGSSSWRDNFISAIFTFVDISEYGTPTSQTFNIGAIPVTVECVNISGVAFLKHAERDTDIPLHWSQEQLARTFLKLPRWCTFQILTPSGYQEIDTTPLIDQSEIGVRMSFNLTTGEWTIRLHEDNSGNTLGVYSGNVGMDLMKMVSTGENAGTWFGNMARNIGGAAMSFIGGISSGGLASAEATHNMNMSILNSMEKDDPGRADALDAAKSSFANKQKYAATNNNVQMGTGIIGSLAGNTTGVSSASGSIGSGITSLDCMPKYSYNGANEGVALFQIVRTNFLPYVMVNENGNIDDDIYLAFCQKYGYPCNRWLPLHSIEGYCRTAGASLIVRGATPSELSEINSFFNSGVYIPANE